MGLFHAATITPTKEEMIIGWAPTQPWGPPEDEPIDVIGAYRFDDPEGEVGMETFLFVAGGAHYQVPLTYRAEPLEAGGALLIGEMEHSALGTRWVYDGASDPLYRMMLAAVTMTGQGEALGMAEYKGRWYVAPAVVRIRGGGWPGERVPLDGFEPVPSNDDGREVFENDRFRLDLRRRPDPEEAPGPMRLTATWEGSDEPLVVAGVEQR